MAERKRPLPDPGPNPARWVLDLYAVRTRAVAAIDQLAEPLAHAVDEPRPQCLTKDARQCGRQAELS